MAWIDTAHKATALTSGVTVNMSLGSVAVGDFIVACSMTTRAGIPGTNVITSSPIETWTPAYTTVVSDPSSLGMSWAIAGSAGTYTITCSGNGSNSFDMFLTSHAFTNPNSSPLSGTPVTATGSGTTADTGTMTPADNDVLVVANFMSQSAGTITENASPGDSGWTVDTENETSLSPGSVVFKIISGAPGTPRSAWTIPSSAWVAGIAAFKPAAAAAAATGSGRYERLIGRGIAKGVQR